METKEDPRQYYYGYWSQEEVNEFVAQIRNEIRLEKLEIRLEKLKRILNETE